MFAVRAIFDAARPPGAPRHFFFLLVYRLFMPSIKALCDDQFRNPDRSQANTFAGLQDHGARFTAQPFSGGPVGAALAAAQTETIALMADVKAAQVAVGGGQARQQAGRAATEADKKQAIKRIQENATALDSDYFIADAAERARLTALLYPSGLMTFTEASLRDLPDLLATYLDAVDDEQAALGKPFTDRTTADLTPFTGTREEQIARKATTTKARDDRRALLDRCTDQLTYNYHLLSAHHRASLAAVAAYYDARYFDDQQTGREGQRRGRAAAGEVKTVLDLGAADPAFVSIALAVEADAAPLEFARAASAAEPPKAWLAVAPGVPQTVALTDLPGTGPLLVVRNTTDRVGHYRVTLEK